MEHTEKIIENGHLLAVIIRNKFCKEGCGFATPDEFPFQVGIHLSKADTHIKAHGHVPFKELKDLYPQEFFYVESGKVEIGLYTKDKKKHSKIILNKGDMIVLNCAHELTFLEDTKMIELKQGPYRGKDEEKEYI